MAPWVMKAVAVGDPANSRMISNATTDCVGVRQYILGLIAGLNALDTTPRPNINWARTTKLIIGNRHRGN